MASDKPQDLKPATEFGEIKVIKNAIDPGKPPGSAEAGPQPGQPEQDPDVRAVRGDHTARGREEHGVKMLAHAGHGSRRR